MHSNKAKILIVDDEPALRESLSQIFIACGYRVCCAHDGFSALDEMKKELPDLILSDLNMPGMSGFDFLSIVHRGFPAIRAIAMSGAFTGSEVPSGVTADAFYEKGTGMNALLHIVGSTIRRPGTVRDSARVFSLQLRALPETRHQGLRSRAHSLARAED
jgi:CheY-like chemotaxis protein